MKILLILILCWLSLQLAVVAGESSTPKPAPQPPPKAVSDEPIKDPFAQDSESPKLAAKVSDPFEGMNRAFFKFNDKFYFVVLKPASTGYSKVAPTNLRASIRRFFVNVKFPVRFVNNLLQAKFKRAGVETTRFVFNSTFGLGGFFDPAHTSLKLEPQPADFDQTLGVYGLPAGAYLNLPFLGPSSVRGAVGTGGDVALTPWTYIGGLEVSLGVRPYEVINDTSLRLGDYETFKKASLDPYVALRSAYFESRRNAVKSGKPQSAAPATPDHEDWSVRHRSPN